MAHIPPSDHFDGKKFHNIPAPSSLPPSMQTSPGKSHSKLWNLIKWRLGRKDQSSRWPRWIENSVYSPPCRRLESDSLAVTFINHSTTLIQMAGLNILTDPIWSWRASPVTFAGPKRVRAAGLALGELPPIDIILLSHDHYDHLDIATLKKIHAVHSPLILAGLNINSVLKSHGLQCIEMDWGMSHNAEGLEIHFLPAKHWSGRKAFMGFNTTLWGSFMLVTPKHKVYFAGDTAYAPHIAAIGSAFGPVDLALLPIGAYKPRWFMKDNHTTPHEAVIMHKELQSRCSVAIHYGTFCLSDEAYDDPVHDLNAAHKELRASYPFQALDFGQSLRII